MKYLIVIPTYNESESITSLLHRLDAVRNVDKSEDIHILLVDDNSPDGTAAIADALGLANFTVLHRSKKEGLGPAYLAGFAWGLERNFDYLLEMDADSSHQPEELPRLLAASHSADLVIGSRWVAGGSVQNWPWHRIFISRFGTSYASVLLRLPYRDLTSGFRVLSAGLLRRIPFEQIETHGYGFQIEMAMRAHDLGATIQEVPITFIERAQGRSKMTGSIVWEAFASVTQWSLHRIFNRR
ncbi:MAG: polyprenol monophosphomannose synthase [Actinomycetes bacterium]